MGARKVIAVTPGDPAGIGPEVLRAALAAARLPKGVTIEIVGGGDDTARPGKPTARSSRAALRALEVGVAGCQAGRFAALVTGPVSKERLARVGFGFPGQTEFLAARCGLREDAVTMAMAGERLRIFLLSTHVALARAIRGITPARLGRTLRHARDFLRGLGIASPRIAIAALNPHAGERGMFGDEEGRVLRPALRAAARKIGAWATRVPVLPADTVFLRASRGDFDGVACLYHDQGLIPFKLLEFDRGVNVTLGLPFPRTSPDHGTAFDIAGKGVSDPGSMIAAIQLAARLAAKNSRIRE
ncbi:MAG: 4-hydroxythreonine-4-phosphate dehydrogenase PdxA [Verrucomicrobiae bacterium]|nr:4-hydroxythreonine-4-phosphate dehydrogenase PdxA [Verrucomicrobiae bacterium]